MRTLENALRRVGFRYVAGAPEGSDGRDASGAVRLRVPDVLLSGNHAEIRRWRKREAVARTLERRPDLLSDARLDDEEAGILRELVAARGKS